MDPVKGIDETAGTELATRFEQINQEFIAMIERLSPSDWSAICPDEGWSVGVTAHHIAAGHAMAVELIPAMVSGAAPSPTWEMIHQANASHAEEYAGVTRKETLAMLRSEGERVRGWLESLGPEDLERSIVLPIMSDEPVSVARIIETVVIGHIGTHQPSIEAAVGSASTPPKNREP